MKEFFSDIMELPVSEGGIHNILKRITKKALPFYLQIKKHIKGSDPVVSGETGVKVNEKNNGSGPGKTRYLLLLSIRIVADLKQLKVLLKMACLYR